MGWRVAAIVCATLAACGNGEGSSTDDASVSVGERLQDVVEDYESTDLDLAIVTGENGPVTVDVLPDGSQLRDLLESASVVGAHGAVYASPDGETTIIRAAVQFSDASAASDTVRDVLGEVASSAAPGGGRGVGTHFATTRVLFALAGSGADLLDPCVRIVDVEIDGDLVVVMIDVSRCHSSDLGDRVYPIDCPAVLEAADSAGVELAVPIHVRPFAWVADGDTVQWTVEGPVTVSAGGHGSVVSATVSADAERIGPATVGVRFERFSPLDLWDGFRLGGGVVEGECVIDVRTVLAATDVAGTWKIVIDVQEASGDCVDEPPYERTIVIDQVGRDLTVAGMGDPEGPWSGSAAGGIVSFAGTRPDGSGRTTSQFTLALDGDTLSGTETWSWLADDDKGFCPFGTSTVEGRRVAVP